AGAGSGAGEQEQVAAIASTAAGTTMALIWNMFDLSSRELDRSARRPSHNQKTNLNNRSHNPFAMHDAVARLRLWVLAVSAPVMYVEDLGARHFAANQDTCTDIS